MNHLNTSKILLIAIILLAVLMFYEQKIIGKDQKNDILPIALTAPHTSAMPICEQPVPKDAKTNRFCQNVVEYQKRDVQAMKTIFTKIGK